MYDAAVGQDHVLVAAAVRLVDQGEIPTARTRLAGKPAGVAYAVIQEHRRTVHQVRHDDVSGFARRKRAPIRFDDAHGTDVLVQVEARPGSAVERNLQHLDGPIVRQHRDTVSRRDPSAGRDRHRVGGEHYGSKAGQLDSGLLGGSEQERQVGAEAVYDVRPESRDTRDIRGRSSPSKDTAVPSTSAAATTTFRAAGPAAYAQGGEESRGHDHLAVSRPVSRQIIEDGTLALAERGILKDSLTVVVNTPGVAAGPARVQVRVCGYRRRP